MTRPSAGRSVLRTETEKRSKPRQHEDRRQHRRHPETESEAHDELERSVGAQVVDEPILGTSVAPIESRASAPRGRSSSNTRTSERRSKKKPEELHQLVSW